MNKSETIGELTKALAKAQGAFEHASKETRNEFFKSKYANLANVIDAAKKPLADNGLAVFQSTDTDENGKVFLITILSHSSGEWISGKYPIAPIKQDPQGYGSAFTYARRYAFSAITGIAADDDDGNAASQPKPEQKRAAPGSMSRTIKPPEPGPEFVDEHGEVTDLSSPAPQSLVFASDEKLMELHEWIDAKNISENTQKAWLYKAGVNTLADLDADKVDKLIESLKKKEA
ncbi:unnamed protein product [Sphagnum balticum]